MTTSIEHAADDGGQATESSASAPDRARELLVSTTRLTSAWLIRAAAAASETEEQHRFERALPARRALLRRPTISHASVLRRRPRP